MILADYYEILDLPVESSLEEIKKAYRKKARLYHPDINHSSDAKDLFIRITEAYDFLIDNHEKMIANEQEYNRIMEEWKKYRQDRSRQRAQVYARASYVSFKRTKFYKSTRILDGTTIIFSFTISVMILFYTISGYIIKLKFPEEENEKPPIFSFILLLTLSVILFTVSFIYLRAYIQESKKRKRKNM